VWRSHKEGTSSVADEWDNGHYIVVLGVDDDYVYFQDPYVLMSKAFMPRKVFGHVSLRFATPTFAILVVSVISLAALWIDLGFLASIVSFGALVAFSAVNLTVIKHYFFDEGEKNVLNNLILPVIGFLLTIWLWFNLSWLTLEVGLIWLAIGFGWLLAVTRGFQRPTPVLAIEE